MGSNIFQGKGPGGWSNFFEVVGGVGSNWQYLPLLSSITSYTPRGHQTGIPKYQVLRGLVETK